MYQRGGFTLAAKALATSQPAVSEQIRALESSLDCRLFDRLGRSIRPTAKADILYPRACAVLEEVERAEDEVRREGKRVAGELVIGASTIPGAYVLPGITAGFKAKHPETSFEIRITDSSEIIDAVQGHELLLGVVGTRREHARLRFEPFMDDELVLAAAPSRKIGDGISWNDLLQLPFLMREPGSGTRQSMEEFCLRRGLDCSRLRAVAVLGSSTAVKEAVKADLGVSILSRLSIEDDLAAGRLRQVALGGMRIRREFYVVTNSKRSLPNHYRVFLQTLRGL